jgi:hypothetical protein
MGLLLARLAHHLLLWDKQWRCGWMVSVRSSLLPPLATPLHESFAALFRGCIQVRYWR